MTTPDPRTQAASAAREEVSTYAATADATDPEPGRTGSPDDWLGATGEPLGGQTFAGTIPALTQPEREPTAAPETTSRLSARPPVTEPPARETGPDATALMDPVRDVREQAPGESSPDPTSPSTPGADADPASTAVFGAVSDVREPADKGGHPRPPARIPADADNESTAINPPTGELRPGTDGAATTVSRVDSGLTGPMPRATADATDTMSAAPTTPRIQVPVSSRGGQPLPTDEVTMVFDRPVKDQPPTGAEAATVVTGAPNAPWAQPGAYSPPAGPVSDQRFGQEQPGYGAPGSQPFGQDKTVFTPPPGSTDSKGGAPGRGWSARKRALVTAAAAFGVLFGVYAVDLVASQGKVPRGVTVAGVEIGGMKRAAAEEKLHQELDPRAGRPISVRAGDVKATLVPSSAGLSLNWPATIEQAGEQPLNPWTRLMSLVRDSEIGVVTTEDKNKLNSALESLREYTDRPTAEGTITFDGVEPKAVEPRAGQKLNVDKSTQVVVSGWAHGEVLDLPVDPQPVRTTVEGVHKALDSVARPAVSAPVTVRGEGKDAVLKPTAIAKALTFEPDDAGGLKPLIDVPAMEKALKPQLASTENPGRDAKINLSSGVPVVEPSADGRGINYAKSLEPLPEVLTRTEGREIKAIYEDQPAKITTEQASSMGVKEIIGEFQTGGFAQDSGTNIRIVAQAVNGTLVKPGETFSLNGLTGPRTAAQGYIEAGVIDHGAPGRAVGGGISQFATTLYNAGYHAGLQDVYHKEHSYYISRYPAGREATVYDGLIDLKFKNDSKNGIVIQTVWTPSNITVRIWGTKRYTVEGWTGERTNPTEPNTINKAPGEPCAPTNGSPGFTVTDTRILRDAATGAEVRRDNRTVRYNPQPKVVCNVS